MAVSKLPEPFSSKRAIDIKKPARGSRKDNVKSVLMTLLSLDETEVRVADTTMTLYIQGRGKTLFTDRGAIFRLLSEISYEVQRKTQGASVGNMFLYPSQPVNDMAQFGIASAAFGDELLWRDVLSIINTLRTYYVRGDPERGIEFLIEDSVRGGLGSGVIVRRSLGGSNGVTA